MSAPRTKRQFAGAASDPSQRQITSFFGPGSRQQTAATASSSPSGAPSVPVLPPTVQANLLSVGMRVRKSVPEGYKTGTAYSGFKLWADVDGDDAATSLRINTTPAAPSGRELLPFCGINKVGGLAAQPAFETQYHELDSEFDSDGDLPTADDVPSLVGGNQESYAFSGPAATAASSTTRKRIFDDAEKSEEPVRVWRDLDAWLDGEVSPRSVAPQTFWGNARVLAVPKGSSARRKGPMTVTSTIAHNEMAASWAVLGQENVTVVDDFEEAHFLDYRAMDLSEG